MQRFLELYLATCVTSVAYLLKCQGTPDRGQELDAMRRHLSAVNKDVDTFQNLLGRWFR
jgi:hypothetical protein